MLIIEDFIKGFSSVFSDEKNLKPWEITTTLPGIITQLISRLGDGYTTRNGIAIHSSAVVEEAVILKAPLLIGPKCFIGAHAYLRGGVYLGHSSSVGPGCEVKTSIIFSHTEIAHLNFIGDSVIGSHINFEAGSMAANYYNERKDKSISVRHQAEVIHTGVEKFGSLVGDHSKIGANAVLSPGTILIPGTVVKRLELINQFDGN
jgi:bifunctional N-acetylglucosamine-1-phosphate-uridyltransferase/glucosamine-1-phosphate-acetyltransferase GlmU-like protein